MHQITLFRDEKFKHFIGEGHSSLSRHHPQWVGHTFPIPTSLGDYGASILAPTALDTPLSKILDPPLLTYFILA